jgi:hypothetical protein
MHTGLWIENQMGVECSQCRHPGRCEQCYHVDPHTR